MPNLKYKKEIQVQFQRDSFDLKILLLFIPDLKVVLDKNDPDLTLDDCPSIKTNYAFNTNEVIDGKPRNEKIEVMLYYMDDVNEDLVKELVNQLREYVEVVHNPDLTYEEVYATKMNLPIVRKDQFKRNQTSVDVKLQYENKSGTLPLPVLSKTATEQKPSDEQPVEDNKETSSSAFEYYGPFIPPRLLETMMVIIRCDTGCTGKKTLCPMCTRVQMLEEERNRVMGIEVNRPKIPYYPTFLFMCFFGRFVSSDLVYSKEQMTMSLLVVDECIERICNPEDDKVFGEIEESKRWYKAAKQDRIDIYKELKEISERKEFDFERHQGRSFISLYNKLEHMVFLKYHSMMKRCKLRDPFAIVEFQNFEQIKTQSFQEVRDFSCDYIKDKFMRQLNIPFSIPVKNMKRQTPTTKETTSNAEVKVEKV